MNNKKKIKVSFSNFWSSFVEDVKNNPEKEWYFGEFLPSLYDVEIVDRNPDFLIYSVMGGNNWNSSKYSGATKVYYSAENTNKNIPRFKACDYSISHHKPSTGKFSDHIDSDRHFQMPIFVRSFGPKGIRSDLDNSFDVDEEFNRKEEFCCLVTRHEYAKVRTKFFKRLHNDYKHVNSAGSALNTMEDNWTVPGWWHDMTKFARKHKFMIAMENRKVHGYTSEKLYNALRSRTVPIYWGDPDVNEYFNSDSFINVDGFENLDEAVDYIEKVDNDDDLYKEFLGSGKLSDHKVYNIDNIKHKTIKIFG